MKEKIGSLIFSIVFFRAIYSGIYFNCCKYYVIQLAPAAHCNTRDDGGPRCEIGCAKSAFGHWVGGMKGDGLYCAVRCAQAAIIFQKQCHYTCLLPVCRHFEKKLKYYYI